MKKGILAGMILMLGMSSFGFSAGISRLSKNNNTNNRYENNKYDNNKYDTNKYEKDKRKKKKKYNEISSRKKKKLSSLNNKLDQKNREIKTAKNQRNVDWRKVDRLTAERKSIKRELDSVKTAFNNEISRNSLTAYTGSRR